MKRIILVLMTLVSMIFLNGCGTVKFGTGVLAESLVHQGGHYIGTKVAGVGLDWRDGQKPIPGFQPNAHIHNSKPEPLAHGASLLLVGLTSEFIMWKTDVLKDEKGENFLTDFWMGYLVGASFDEMNYGIRRSGLLGDHNGNGQDDLGKNNFGGYHKLAGAVSAVEGIRIAYKLAKGKRTKTYWTKVKIWTDSIKEGGIQIGVSYIF